MTPPTLPASGLRIMIVDDDPGDAELIAHRLSRSGFELTWTRVDDEADFLREIPASDLVICDYSMPTFSPFRALELMRSRDHELPLLLVSGTVGEEVAVEAMKAGAWDYLLKDRLERLGPAVRQALEKRDLRRRQRSVETALRASEERFRYLTENIMEVFWITDPNTQSMLYVSPAYEQIWGRSCAELMARPLSWLEAVHPDDRDRIIAAIPGQSENDYDEEYRVVRPDGSLRWIRDRAFPVRNARGEVERVVGVAQDTTEHRELQRQLHQAQKMESVGQLAGGIAHDFNNLLSVILTNATLLNELKLPDDGNELAQEVVHAADRAAALTRQLLVFSRRGTVQLGELDLNDVVRGLTRMLHRLLGEDVRIEMQLAAERLYVRADTGMLEQVLMNLAVNARDAMPRGGALTIETRAARVERARSRSPAMTEHFACLQVTDSGCGIPEEIRAKIFEPFFTTKEVGKGTGLGLATVYGIVEQHRGWIELESEVGEGTSFTIFLPMVAGSEEIPTLRTIAAVPHGHGETVLVVEDDPAVRATVTRLLIRHGYRVVAAGSGPEALGTWHAQRDEIRILVTDQVMPGGMTGTELARRVRADRPQVAVIFTSGYNPNRTAHDEVDGCYFLAKPFDYRALVRLVRRGLDESADRPTAPRTGQARDERANEDADAGVDENADAGADEDADAGADEDADAGQDAPTS